MTKGPGPYDPQPQPPHPNPDSMPPGQQPVEIPVLPPHEPPATDPHHTPAGPVDPNRDPDARVPDRWPK
jgi:hypothetical protein